MIVTVQGHADAMLLNHGYDALRAGEGGGSGDDIRAQRLGLVKGAVDFGVGHVVAEAEAVGEDFNAGILKFGANSGEGIERRLDAPFPQRGGIQTLGLHVARVKLALADADLSHGANGRVERHVAEAVGLGSDLHAVKLGINARAVRNLGRMGRQNAPERQRRRGDGSEVSPGNPHGSLNVRSLKRYTSAPSPTVANAVSDARGRQITP